MLRQLVELAIHLDGMGLKEEADVVDSFLKEFLEKEESVAEDYSVLMHLGGPSGSGKTSLLEKIDQLYPEVICKDLDEFDEEASEELGLIPGWKNSEDLWDKWGEEHFEIKQQLLDDFISAHAGKKIILAGIASEGEYSLQFLPQFRILLNTPLEESLSRRIKRDKDHPGAYKFWKNPKSMEEERREGAKIIKELTSAGYESLSADEVIDLLESELGDLEKEASYNTPREGKKRWSVKYKKKINCSNPKGFSQEQYCKRKANGGNYQKN